MTKCGMPTEGNLSLRWIGELTSRTRRARGRQGLVSILLVGLGEQGGGKSKREARAC